MNISISTNPVVWVSTDPADSPPTSNCSFRYPQGFSKTYLNGSTLSYPDGLTIYYNDSQAGWAHCACIAPFDADPDIAGLGVSFLSSAENIFLTLKCQDHVLIHYYGVDNMRYSCC